ncbi:MAG: hypothetical protein EOM91_17530 [Sphingobacteriia bacterium]|jgi:hypothetical protein|nr:hypothetical protein [Sphingobacteriia bacterium]
MPSSPEIHAEEETALQHDRGHRGAASRGPRRGAGREAALRAALCRELREALQIGYGAEINWPASALRVLRDASASA